ncbi:hypothetical protein ACFQ0B_24740 [Nonomuraea thailandensis]
MIALLERRTVHSVVPPRVECELTALGVSLHEVIRSPVIWTEEHRRGSRTRARPTTIGRRSRSC